MIDPLHPTGVPELHPLGAEATVAVLNEKLRARLCEWRTCGADDPAAASSLRRNLLHVLDLESLPLPTETNREEFCLECVVCFSYKLEEVRRARRANGNTSNRNGGRNLRFFIPHSHGVTRSQCCL